MIKIICDECGGDCDLVGYDLLIRSIHNPCPTSLSDTGNLSITCDKELKRFVLCQKCYDKHMLPNLFMEGLIFDKHKPSTCSNCPHLDFGGDYPQCTITDETRGYNFDIKQQRMDKCPYNKSEG